MNNYSQIGQDVFVLNILKNKLNGLFLDIGCGEPVKINNTFLLENNYSWKGINIDLNSDYTKLWESSNRKNSKFLLHDALTVNYDKIITDLLKENNRDRIDYLSMDLEPPAITLEALKKLPLDKYRFSVITFEHDLYRNNQHLLEESREIFEKYNYKLAVSNINNQEDWWIDPTVIDI
jgi:hypothetical protein